MGDDIQLPQRHNSFSATWGGEQEERGDEANETQSRGDIQDTDGLCRGQGRQGAGGVGGKIGVASIPTC